MLRLYPDPSLRKKLDPGSIKKVDPDPQLCLKDQLFIKDVAIVFLVEVDFDLKEKDQQKILLISTK